MRKIFVLILMLFTANACAVVEKTGQVRAVSIWGGIAKASVCDTNNACKIFWVSVADSHSQAVLSMWLTARVSQEQVYFQGYDPDKPEFPYSNASKFYAMNF